MKIVTIIFGTLIIVLSVLLAYRAAGMSVVNKANICGQRVVDEINNVNSKYSSENGLTAEQVGDLVTSTETAATSLASLNSCVDLGVFEGMNADVVSSYVALNSSATEYVASLQSIAEKAKNDEDTWAERNTLVGQYTVFDQALQDYNNQITLMKKHFLLEF